RPRGARADKADHRRTLHGRASGGDAGGRRGRLFGGASSWLPPASRPPAPPAHLLDPHLPSIRVPVLCANGTRDPLCTPELMNRAIERVTAPWEMLWLEGADHSFHVLKSSGRTEAAVIAQVADAAQAW